MKNGVLLLLLSLGLLRSQTVTDGPRFDSDGKLNLPREYREWVYLTSGLGMTYGPAAEAKGSDPLFDTVFVNPAAYRVFLNTGHWPDKTMFILEVRRSISKGSINNGGHYQGEIESVEAAVKDEARFPGKWGYFGFGRGEKAALLPATSSCYSCHRENAAVENTFVQFYPVLLDVATKKKTLNSAYIEKAAKSH